MTIDYYFYDNRQAKITCRQLGYHDDWSVGITDIKWTTRNPRVGYFYSCAGSEDSLNDCDYFNDWITEYTEFWYNNIRVGVECQMNTSQSWCNQEGSIRLSNGTYSNEGRVEICLNGYWGTICSNGWDENDAFITCKRVGHPTLRPIPMINGYFGKGIGPVHMTSVGCTGNEDGLDLCPYVNGIGVTNCYHGKDVGVICPTIDEIIHYDVNISYEPHSVQIGSQVLLYCNVLPQPPINSTYQWTTTVSGAVITQLNPTHPNATITIHAGHPYDGNYYCIVKYNGVTLGRGYQIIHVSKGILYSVINNGNVTDGSDINLTVIVTNSPITKYLRELNWYFNGLRINANSDIHFNILNNNKTLIISNISQDYFGEYSVQFDGLILYPYNRNCELKTLESLRDYPVLNALVFSVSSNGIKVHQYSRDVDTKVVSFTTDATTVTMTTNNNRDIHDTSMRLYHNGGTVLPRVTTSGILVHTRPHYDITINDPTIHYTGYYEFQYVTTSSLILSSYSCPSIYNTFYSSSSYLKISKVVKDFEMKRLEYYEKPTVSLHLMPNRSQLVCSATGGYPQYYNITLIKNGVSIANDIGPHLTYSTTGIKHKYGLYQCTVDNTAVILTNSIILKEEVTFMIHLKVEDCKNWNDNDQFEMSIKNQAETSCNCLIHNATFANSTLSCSNNILTFHSTLAYSSPDGSQTSSDIISRLFYDLANGTVLNVNGVSLPAVDATCATTNGLLAGLFIAGFVIATFIFGLLTAMILMVKCIRRVEKPKESNAPEGVHYDSSKKRVSTVTGLEHQYINSNQNNKTAARVVTAVPVTSSGYGEYIDMLQSSQNEGVYESVDNS
jgi:hypothetical protein